MNKISNFLYFRRHNAMTFLEILIALVIMSVAMLPIFGIIHKGAEDTDINASQAYALNKATEILNTVLDNVPFEALRQGIPAGYIKTEDISSNADYKKYDATWAQDMSGMLFPGCKKDGKGWRCQGIVTDPRGISYQVTLRVEDLVSKSAAVDTQPETLKIGGAYPSAPPADFGRKDELVFTFLKNPAKLADPKWIQKYNPFSATSQPPRFETELASDRKTGVAEPNTGVDDTNPQPLNIYRDEGYEDLPANSPRYIDPTATRYTQQMASEKVNYPTSDEASAYCTMKRLIVELQWNLDKTLYDKPAVESTSVQRVHLMTIKGDINR